MKKLFPTFLIIALISILLNAFVAIGNANPAISTTDSDVPIAPPELPNETPLWENNLSIQSTQSKSTINLDDFRNDGRFNHIDGTGYAVVILDTGIDLDHPHFGPDNNNDGIADRIVYSYDFADGDADASDKNGHGSNVSSIVGGNYGSYEGIAPGIDIIHLKVFPDYGYGRFSYIEHALQWVVANAETYNVVSVNMSIGDGHNHVTAKSLYGLSDEIAALANAGIVVVSSAGNDYYLKNSAPGIMYPAADPNSLAVGATYNEGIGYVSYPSGAVAYSSGANRIIPFSQRHETLLDIFAPGSRVRGAGTSGGTTTYDGTSQAAPHIAGLVSLMQEMAQERLGRLLSVSEVRDLLIYTAKTINDGDDEHDNVVNTGLDFPLVDLMGIAEAIWAMGEPPTATPTNTPIPTATNTPVPTNTPIPTATNTPVPTNTAVPTATNIPEQSPTSTATSVKEEPPSDLPEEPLTPYNDLSEKVYLPLISNN